MSHAEGSVKTGRIEPIKPSPTREFTAVGVALVDCRCGKCQRLLFRGIMRGEIKCPRCGHMNRWI